MSDIPRLDFNELVVSLGRASEEMNAVKEQLRVANHRSALAKNVAVVGMVIGVFGIAVGTGGLIYAERANNTADEVQQIQEERAADQVSSRLASCVQQNVQTQRVRSALIAGVSVLTPQNGEDGRSERVATFINLYTKTVEKQLPFRDCSPNGIARYFEDPPGDPAGEG